VTDQENAAVQGNPSRRGLLIGTYVVAAVLGCVVGLLPFGASSSTPRARVGLALQEETPQAGPVEWAALRDDVETVRLDWKTPDRDVFDLVVAVRGLESDGAPDWSKAERICRQLHWPRCDHAALEQLRLRSRP
jgi:hypothetical protein